MRKRNWYLKLTTDDRKPIYSTSKRGYPVCGRWTRRVKPILCVKGWHACAPKDIMEWGRCRSDDRLFVCQLTGELVIGYDKVAAERIRLLFEIEQADMERVGNYLRRYHARNKQSIRWVREVSDIYELIRALEYYPTARRYFERYISHKVRQWEVAHGEH